MREAQKPDHVSLNSLLGRLKEGRYMVPDFQREFEWKARDIRDLTKSIFLDYYIGSLLLWKGTKENFGSLSCEPLYGQTAGSPEYIVLDGQQRLTAINYAFVAPDMRLPTRVSRALYFLRIDRWIAEEYDEAFDFWYVNPGKGAGTAGWDGIGWPIGRQFENHVFPLAVVGTSGSQLYKWLGGYKDYWAGRVTAAADTDEAKTAQHHAAAALRFEELVESITGKFQISYIELDRELAIDKVCDIFTQINSKGVRLDVFDLLNALLKPKGIQLKAMWREAEPRLAFLAGGKLNVYILQVMSLLRQSHCSPQYLYYLLPGAERKTRRPDGSFERQVMIATDDEFRARWAAAVKALEQAVSTLRQPQEFGVTSATYLPYYAILPVFAAALAEIRQLPPAQRLPANGRFRRWYWASIFTNRYSASSETTAARDIQDLRAWFDDEEAEPPVIGEFAQRLQTLDLRGEVKKGFSIYNAIFNLLVIAGARDWVSGAIPHADELDDHHIVPKSWGAANGIGHAVDTILNRTPLTGETNRNVICDRLPNAYLPELMAKNGRDTVETLLASHFVSPAALDILLRAPFSPADFEAFVAERQRTVVAAIKATLLDKRADLPADLRALDDEVERIELGLRRLVAARLDDDAAVLPPHVKQKIDDRIAAAAKKLPGGDDGRWTALAAALEFADLQELRSVMESTVTAARFADLFPNKSLMATRFTQLGDLRNGIRHSRTVGDVVRHEGQAAIHWFGEALAKAG